MPFSDQLSDLIPDLDWLHSDIVIECDFSRHKTDKNSMKIRRILQKMKYPIVIRLEEHFTSTPIRTTLWLRTRMIVSIATWHDKLLFRQEFCWNLEFLKNSEEFQCHMLWTRTIASIPWPAVIPTGILEEFLKNSNAI